MSYLMQYEPGFTALHLESAALRRSQNKTRELERQLAAARRKLALFSDDEVKAKKELRRGASRRWERCGDDASHSASSIQAGYTVHRYWDDGNYLFVILCPKGWNIGSCFRWLKEHDPAHYECLRPDRYCYEFSPTGHWFTPFNAKFHKRTGRNARWIITFQRWRDV